MANRKRKPVKKSKTAVVASGSTIRFEEPSSSRQPKPSVTVMVAQELNPTKGFLNFIRDRGVVSLAVGFAIATQAQGLIKQLLSSFIDPLFAVLLNGDKLSTKVTIVHFHNRAQPLAWGMFVYALLDFMFVLLAIYLILRFFSLDKLDKPKETK